MHIPYGILTCPLNHNNTGVSAALVLLEDENNKRENSRLSLLCTNPTTLALVILRVLHSITIFVVRFVHMSTSGLILSHALTRPGKTD